MNKYYVSFSYLSIYGTTVGAFFPFEYEEVTTLNIEHFFILIREQVLDEIPTCQGGIQILSWIEVPEG